MVVIQVPHLTYYAVALDSGDVSTAIIPGPQPNPGTPISRSILSDIDVFSCPVHRDCSSSYYDKLCGPCTPAHKAADLSGKEQVICTSYSPELNSAYSFAFANSITTINNCQNANLE